VNAALKEVDHDALGVFKISKDERLSRANRYTGGVEASLHPVETEGAFVYKAIGVNIASVVGARGDAGLTARAFVAGDDDRTALVKVAGTCGTAAYARSIVTVITTL